MAARRVVPERGAPSIKSSPGDITAYPCGTLMKYWRPLRGLWDCIVDAVPGRFENTSFRLVCPIFTLIAVQEAAGMPTSMAIVNAGRGIIVATKF